MPERTCIVCRRIADGSGAGELARLVVGDTGVVIAEPGAPGRGAWICRSSTCPEALKPGDLARAFRRKPADLGLSEAVLERLRAGVSPNPAP